MKRKKQSTITYRDRPEIANSDISNALVSPELYYSIKTKEYRPIVYPQMKDGTVAHCKILTPDIFWEEYFLQEETLHPKQKEFVDNIIAAKHKYDIVNKAIVEQVYRDVYTKPKEGDGMILYTKLENQIKGIYSGRQPITKSTAEMAEKRLELLMRNEEAVEILKLATVREESLFWEMEGMKCKGQLDANGIIEMEKRAIIADLKIGKDPTSEEQLIEKIKLYKYPRQLRYYERGMKSSEELNELYPGLKNYSFEKYLIHVDPVVCRVFRISEEHNEWADEEITKGLNIIREVELKGLRKQKIITL